MLFSLDQDQLKKLEDWKTQQYAIVGMLEGLDKTGAIGGRFTYRFTPTGLGDLVVVTDFVTKQEINLTDFENW